jgi:hypothetical protein
MLRRSTVILVLATTAFIARGGIDFTPTATEFVGEGIKYQKLTFRKDKQLVEYYPPPGWSFAGSAERIQLRPPKKNFAEAVIEAAQLSTPQLVDEKIAKALTQQFLSTMPAGSQFVTVVSEEQNPVPLDGKPTFEVTVSYQLMGEKFLRSALYANLTDTQLIFRLSARKDDFQALHFEFKRSISSWHPIESGEEPAEVAKKAEQPSAR